MLPATIRTTDYLDGIYGTIWFDELGDLGDVDGQVHQRNVTVFADGEVDRSPCPHDPLVPGFVLR